jgi:restriction system protein
LNVLDAAEVVLRDAGEPLHYTVIAERAVAEGHWETTGKTPWATMNARLSTDLGRNGENSRFRRVAPGIYSLAISTETTSPAASLEAETMSFTDAAERVLLESNATEPLHYQEITRRAIDHGYVVTAGKTPGATTYAGIVQEIDRRARRGEPQRFTRPRRGLIGLTRWSRPGLEHQIQEQNKRARRDLLARVRGISPADFESLVGQLLTALGFEDVVVTDLNRDGGVDVRGTLVVGDVIRTRMAVQAKRWANNVQAPVVQQVRGSLGAHEQGLIITTSDFSPGARSEAARPDAVPVGLMNGEQLVALLVEHEILARRAPFFLIEIESTADPES